MAGMIGSTILATRSESGRRWLTRHGTARPPPIWYSVAVIALAQGAVPEIVMWERTAPTPVMPRSCRRWLNVSRCSIGHACVHPVEQRFPHHRMVSAYVLCRRVLTERAADREA
jgi:hypothetical protein